MSSPPATPPQPTRGEVATQAPTRPALWVRIRRWVLALPPGLGVRERQDAQFLMTIHAAVVLVVVVGSIGTAALFTHDPRAATVDLIGEVVTLVAVFVSASALRRGALRIASWSLVGVAVAVPFAVAVAVDSPNPEYLLCFQLVAVTLASMLFSMRETAVLAVVMVALDLSLPVLRPEVTVLAVLQGPLTLLAICGVLLLALVRHRARQRAAHHLEEQRQRDEEHATSRLQALGTLAGGVAHDFNNILGSIVAFTELAQDGTEPGSQVNQDLDTVLEVCTRGQALVDQVLAFTRRREPPKEPVQPARIILEVCRDLETRRPPGVELVLDRHLDDGYVLASPVELHQVVMNLCGNALDAMSGTGRLRITLRRFAHPPPGVLSPRHGAMLELLVRDDGPGMPPEVLARAFDPFFTTKPPGKGTGLGLAVVRSIVDGYGGAVVIESEPGWGCAVHVWLPLAPQEPDVGRAVTSGGWQRGGHGSIMLVEDDETLLIASARILADEGYAVEAFADPLEARRALEEAPDEFDLLITDLAMQGLSGLDLARVARGLRPELPVLLCSGLPEAAEGDPVAEGLVRQVLQKPLRRKQLCKAVRAVLQR